MTPFYVHRWWRLCGLQFRQLTATDDGGASEGNAALSALAILLFLSIVGSGAAAAVAGATAVARRSVDRVTAGEDLEGSVVAVIEALVADPTPDSDCPVDPVWTAIEELDGVVELRDASSRINPNTIRKNVLDRTGLGGLIFDSAHPAGSDALQQYREDEGMSTDILSHYGAFFTVQAFDELLTGYGWANINVTDEFVLRSLFRARTGDSGGAERFRDRAVSLIGQEPMLAPAQLSGFLGTDFDRVYPVVNAEPLWNVHFLPEPILREILSYPALGVEDPVGATAAILSLREVSEITLADLCAITELPSSSRLHQYLGVRTWFWSIRATSDDARLDVVVARIPGGHCRYQVIERSYTGSQS